MTTKKTAPAKKSKASVATKAAASVPPARPLADTSATSEEEPLYTLAFLTKALPTPSEALLTALAQSHSEETCLAIGRAIGSAKVISDGTRLVSAAYYYLQRPEPALRTLLQEVGLTPMLLSAAVHDLSELQELLTHQERMDFASNATRQEVKEEISVVRARLLLTRDAAWLLARFVARPDPGLSAKVEAVSSGTATPAELARQVKQLADIVELALAHKGDAVAALVSARAITSAQVKRWRAEAQAAEKTEQAQRAQSVRANVDQVELDRTDGLVILQLREILRMLELAGKQDASIRYIRLYALSALLGRRAGKQATPTPTPTPTPPGLSPAALAPSAPHA